MAIKHWHIAYGVPGYGPEGSEGFEYMTNHKELAIRVAEFLSESSDRLWETMTGTQDAAGEAPSMEDYKSLWEDFQRLRDVDDEATFWKAKEEQWSMEFWEGEERQTALRKGIDDRLAKFPFPVSYNYSLYVWLCSTSGKDEVCEHLEEDE